MFIKNFFFLLTLIIGLSFGALVGSEISISTANEDQQNPHVIYLPDKKIYFVVWEDWRDITDSDIYGVFMDEDGNICGSEFIVAGGVGDTDSQTASRVAYSPNFNKILVVWQDTRGNNTQGYVYYRDITNLPDSTNCATFDPATLTLGTETPVGFTSINRDDLERRLKPKVVYNPADDTFLIAWVEKRSLAKYVSVDCLRLPVSNSYYTASYEFADNLFVGFVKLKASDLSVVDGPEILRAPADDLRGSIITNARITSVNYGTKQSTIEIEFISSINNLDIACEGTSNECVFIVEGNRDKATLTCECEDRDNDGTCADFIDTDGDGNADTYVDSPANSTLTFSEFPEEENNGPDNLHIFAITYTQYTKNTLLFTRVDIGSSQDSTNPAVETDPISKRFLVVWEDRRDNVQNPKVYGQLLYTTGVRYGSNFIISYQDTDGDGQNDPEITNSKQTAPYVEYDPVNQRFMVVWQDGRNSETQENLDIYAQYVDLEGSLIGVNIQVSTNKLNQLTPSVAYSYEKNEFLAVWKDARNLDTTGADIYGQRFTPGQPQIVIYDARGTRKLVPAVIDFGIVEVNVSVPAGFSIRNDGNVPVNIKCVVFDNNVPEFTFEPALPVELTDCTTPGIDLQPGQLYPIQIKFTPTQQGTFSNTITIVSDTETLKVSVYGSAVTRAITAIKIYERDDANDGKIDLGLVEPAVRKIHMITVENTGNVTLKIALVINGEGYEVKAPVDPDSTVVGSQEQITSQDILFYLHPGKVKPIYIIFDTPENPTKDVYTGTLDVLAYQHPVELDENPTPVFTKPIDLTATIARAKIQLDKYSVDFGLVDVNTTATQTITVSNPGNIPLQITDCISDNPDIFRVSCPASVDAGANGTITVSFTPQDVTPYTGQITIKTNAGDVTLSVAGEGAGAKIVVVPQVVNFEFVNIGKRKVAEITILNEGNRTLEISSITEANTSDPITVNYVGTLPIQIEPESYYKLLIEFHPQEENLFTDTITIQNNSYNAPNLSIGVQGIGLIQEIEIEPNSSVINFEQVKIGETSSKRIVIRNVSMDSIILEHIDTPSGPFSINFSKELPYELKPGEEVSVIVSFAPEEKGVYDSKIGFLFNTNTEPIRISLYGTAVEQIQANLLRIKYNNIETTNIYIDDVGVNELKVIKIYIENPLSENISINEISLTGSGFSLISPSSLPVEIPSGESLPIKLLFQPTVEKIYTATLTIKDSLNNIYSVKIKAAATSIKSLTEGVKIISYNVRDLPNNYTSIESFRIYSETTDPITIWFAYNISEKVILKQLKNGEWKEIYPNNETQCIEILESTNTILKLSIEDNSDCDHDNTPGVIIDPIVVAEKIQAPPSGGAAPTTKIDTSPAGGAGCNSVGGNAVFVLLLLLFGRKLLRKFV